MNRSSRKPTGSRLLYILALVALGLLGAASSAAADVTGFGGSANGATATGTGFFSSLGVAPVAPVALSGTAPPLATTCSTAGGPPCTNLVLTTTDEFTGTSEPPARARTTGSPIPSTPTPASQPALRESAASRSTWTSSVLR